MVLNDSSTVTPIPSYQFLNQNNYNSVSNELDTYNESEITPLETEQESQCHPSYEGACLNPDVSDYDCVGGSGNGPYYTGPVQVVGPDAFGLDRDHDGWGCE